MPPDRTIEEAAIIAACNSKGRNSSRVDVDYTFIRNVKKPNVAYHALRYLKNHGLKETIERAKQGNEPAVPPKNNVIGFYRFVVDNDPIPFNQKEYEKHKNDKK